MRPDLTLRAFAAADLPMLADWLATPALRQWWGDPLEQLALVAGDLHGSRMDRKITSLRGAPCRGVWSYRQTGFQDIAVRSGEDGRPVLVMQSDPASFW